DRRGDEAQAGMGKAGVPGLPPPELLPRRGIVAGEDVGAHEDDLLAAVVLERDRGAERLAGLAGGAGRAHDAPEFLAGGGLQREEERLGTVAAAAGNRLVALEDLKVEAA